MKLFLLSLLILSSNNVYAGSNTGGLVNNLAWVFIGLFTLYQIIKGDKEKIIYTCIWSVCLVAIGLYSTGGMVIFFISTLIGIPLYGLYFDKSENYSTSSRSEDNKTSKEVPSSVSTRSNELNPTVKKYNIPYMSDKSVEKKIRNLVKKIDESKK